MALTMRGARILLTTVAVALLTAPMTASPRPAVADEVTINDSPPVGLILLDDLMSGRSRVGDTVHYETVANVVDDRGDVLIPAGSRAFGRVTRSKGSGMFGKRGQLQMSCEYAILPGGAHVPLTGDKVAGAGANATAATVAVTVLVSPIGLLIKGGTVKYNRGMPVAMYVPEGVRVEPAPNAPEGLHARFTPRGKDAQDIAGLVTGFDGNSYTIRTDHGPRQLAVKDISSITLDGFAAG